MSRPYYDSVMMHAYARNAHHQQPPPSSTSQQAWQLQQENQQQLYVVQQQQQEQLHIRGQGRGSSYNQPVKPLHEGTQYPPDYQGKNYVQPTNHQPRSMQPTNIDNHQLRSMQPEYNIAGTNAAPLQGKLPNDDYNYYGLSSGPASLDNSLTKPRPAGSIQPTSIDNHQLRLMQPQYNIAGANAAPLQGKLPNDNDYNYYGRSSGPASLDSSLTKLRPAGGNTNHPPPVQSPIAFSKRAETPTQYALETINEEIHYQADRQRRHQEYERPTQYASEAINEEIRYQSDRQRRHQEYERFDCNLQLDPYLICPKCKLQFREGQLPEYRHHIDNCHH